MEASWVVTPASLRHGEFDSLPAHMNIAAETEESEWVVFIDGERTRHFIMAQSALEAAKKTYVNYGATGRINMLIYPAEHESRFSMGLPY